MSSQLERPQAKRFRSILAKRFLIRFHMSLILAAVISSAVLCSKLLLFLGVQLLPIRYPIAAVVAYLVFVGLIRIWVAYVTSNGIWQSRRMRSSSSNFDLDSDPGFGVGSSSDATETVKFGGGSSGGGGASRSFDVDTADTPGSGGSWLPSMDFDFDLDDGGWILIVLGILIAVIFGAGAYLVYIAPEMLPEVAAQVVLAGTLKRASRKLADGEWAMSIVRGTIVPFLVVFVMTIALGVVAHRSCPQATKLAEALSCPEK